MNRIIVILALLFLVSCQKVIIIPGTLHCRKMLISDALPVQFWLSDCETFNEKEAKGVHHVCWCHPWNCADNIAIQVKHPTGQELYLLVNDNLGNALAEVAFVEILAGVYSTSFLPNDYAICDKQIQLLITDNLSPSTEIAKSDCLDIATSHDETELFTYSNNRNFAGLVYENLSPDTEFSIRVPCRFFHEEFPEEDEAIELTSSIITTSAQVKSQKLLEVKHAPYYFHKKLKLILKHHFLSVEGLPPVEYKKEEKYEIIKGNQLWPLKSATCLLTEKNSVLRNVL